MQIRQLAERVNGRTTSEADAVEANLIRQSLINNFMASPIPQENVGL